MKISLLAAAVWMLGFSQLHAAELQVIAGGGIAGPMRELAPSFERATGHKVVVRFATTPELVKMATSGDTGDVAVVPSEFYNDAAARAKYMAAPTVDIARVGLGIAVRAGAPKPEISTPDQLKQALLDAKSIATVPASAAGAQVQKVFDQLGIGDAMKARQKAQPGPAQLVQAVANGDAELGVFLSNVLLAPGIDLVGPFPKEVQLEILYKAGVASGSAQADAANAFIKFLTSPDAVAVIRAKGMAPG